VLNLGTVQKVLQNLVREGVSIRDLLTIVENLADFGTQTKDSEQLTELIRQKMSRAVTKPYISEKNVLPIITFDEQLDKTVQDSVRQSDQGTFLALEPAKAQKIIQALNKFMEKNTVTEGQPVLLVSPQVRPHLAQLIQRFIPNLPVISQAEIPADIKLESVKVVRIDNAG
jgi:flagellar biosynthesis protein FlhA